MNATARQQTMTIAQRETIDSLDDPYIPDYHPDTEGNLMVYEILDEDDTEVIIHTVRPDGTYITENAPSPFSPI